MDREEFQKFLMGGLARTVAERRQYAKKSKMHRKLAILLDRISFGIDRRTKALHSMFDAVDDDGSGFLTATELRELMAKYADHEGHVPSDEEVMEFMEQIDENGEKRKVKVLIDFDDDTDVDQKLEASTRTQTFIDQSKFSYFQTIENNLKERVK